MLNSRLREARISQEANLTDQFLGSVVAGVGLGLGLLILNKLVEAISRRNNG